ncbi:fimbrial protein [Klebsiella aerogenes]
MKTNSNIDNYYQVNIFLLVCNIIVAFIRFRLKVLSILGFFLISIATVQAKVDNWEVEGANGILYIHGVLTESACRLEMSSARQEIILGDIGTGRLRSIGSRGTPVRFDLQLTDCLPGPANNRDSRTGVSIWSDNQPAVSVSFRGVQDTDNPQLVRVLGISGFGLRIQNIQGEDVRLGSRGKPLMLTPGQNVLSYVVTPERTSAILVPGSYRAVVDFHLSYD